MTKCISQLVSRIQVRLEAIVRAEEGQGLTEYALILVLVSIVAVVALQALGTNITSVLNEAAVSL